MRRLPDTCGKTNCDICTLIRSEGRPPMIHRILFCVAVSVLAYVAVFSIVLLLLT